MAPPVVPAGPPPPSPNDETNTFATLSVVFAFLFAPAGAVLGHLGLSQIKRTGQRGRDRALVGLSLSYTLIVVAVAALVIWAVIPSSSNTTTTEAKTTAPGTNTPVTPPPTTTTTTPEPPPLPLVTEAQLPGLLLNLDDSIRLVGLNDGYSPYEETTLRNVTDLSMTPPECLSVVAPGLPVSYGNSGHSATLSRSFTNLDVKTMFALGNFDERATLYADGPAASRQVDAIEKAWQGCHGSNTQNGPSGPVVFDVGEVTRSATDPSIVLLSSTVQDGPKLMVGSRSSRAVAAKSNVVVDVVVFAPDPGGRAEAAAIEILSRIPG
ncbi:sensor domain-containing protein [Mycolicibacterium fortuitum]|uniref:sensor domain-containing protein n=1 Tax=Mycolicibacterium fortuitum TaxID=1766 RepID=UPI000B1D457A|nr:sensor domain-containing protein [Mycolicibacterium fortuitum]